ncbi:MAG: cytochrome c oxidase subunit II [Rhodospirillales bacterium]|nr:cytochrome c oxidase subunit II [Rhodospirillales bacterium]
MVLAIILVLLAVGSVIFHFWSPWWFTPIASNWGSMDDAINITFAITGVAYVAVILFMAYCIYKYRHREDRRADYEPENTKLELWLTWITAAGVVGLLTPGLIAWNDFVTVPEDATEFEVVGSQWEWKYRLPGKDGKLGTSSIRLIADNNPFGINPKDPNGKDDVLIEGEDLHLPLNRPIKMLLRSIDVLHDFYVPQFRAKMDLVPGMVTFFWLTPTRTGTFDILCAELCGVGHHAMRGSVIVDDKAAYQKWLGGQKTFAALYPKAAAGADQTAKRDTKIKMVLTANKQNNEEGK